MGLLEILPKNKIEITEEKDEFPAISFEEAKLKVERAINNIPKNEGLNLSAAIEKVICSSWNNRISGYSAKAIFGRSIILSFA